jgi:hypothetical protein
LSSSHSSSENENEAQSLGSISTIGFYDLRSTLIMSQHTSTDGREKISSKKEQRRQTEQRNDQTDNDNDGHGHGNGHGRGHGHEWVRDQVEHLHGL